MLLYSLQSSLPVVKQLYDSCRSARLRADRPAGDASAEDDASDDEDEEEGGMSLMDMLNANEAAEEVQGDLNGKKQAQGKGKGKVLKDKQDGSRAAPAVEDSEEEMDGMDQDIDHEMDHEMDQDESESEEDDDEEDRHERLLGFVGSLGDKAAAADRAASDRRSSQLLKEGEFNRTAVGPGGVAAGGEASRKGGVTIEVRE